MLRKLAKPVTGGEPAGLSLFYFKGNYLNGCRIIRIERYAGGGAHYSGLFVIEEKDGVRGLDIYCQCAKPYDETYMDGGNEPVLRYNNSYYHRR